MHVNVSYVKMQEGVNISINSCRMMCSHTTDSIERARWIRTTYIKKSCSDSGYRRCVLWFGLLELRRQLLSSTNNVSPCKTFVPQHIAGQRHQARHSFVVGCVGKIAFKTTARHYSQDHCSKTPCWTMAPGSILTCRVGQNYI